MSTSSKMIYKPEEQVLVGFSRSAFYAILVTLCFGILTIFYLYQNFSNIKKNTIKILVFFRLYSSNGTFCSIILLKFKINHKKFLSKLLVILKQLYPLDEVCALCLSEPQYPIQLLCGHEYCAQCFLEFLGRINRLQQIKCPYCRQNVRLIIRKYEHQEGFQANDQTLAFSQSIRDWNLRQNQKRTIWQIVADFPQLLSQTLRFVLTFHGFVVFVRMFLLNAYIILLVLYILSPYDLIPEMMGIIGIIDDVFVVIILIIYFANIFYQFNFRREQNLNQ